jgi:hypothetical protein
MILSVLFGRVIMQQQQLLKITTIGDTDNCRLTTLVNSASTAPPIGLPSKGAKFCHTSNIFLVEHQRRHALWRLFLIPLWVVVGCWSLVDWPASPQYGFQGFERFTSKRIRVPGL